MRRIFVLISAIAAAAAVAALGAYATEDEKKQPGVLFREGFENAGLHGRGWYDGGRFRIAKGAFTGQGCLEYEWTSRRSKVSGSSVSRHLFEPSEEIYVRFYLKLSKGWGWSGRGLWILTWMN